MRKRIFVCVMCAVLSLGCLLSAHAEENGIWDVSTPNAIVKALDQPMPADTVLKTKDETKSKESDVVNLLRNCTEEMGEVVQVVRLTLESNPGTYTPQGKMVIGFHMSKVEYPFYGVYRLDANGQIQLLRSEFQDEYLVAESSGVGVFLITGSDTALQPVASAGGETTAVRKPVAPLVFVLIGISLVAIAVALIFLLTKKKRVSWYSHRS